MIRRISGWILLLGASAALMLLDLLGKRLTLPVLSFATLCACGFMACDYAANQKSRYWQRILAIVAGSILGANLILNMSNVYRFSLPSWFYILKIYRFITLSPIPIVFFLLILFLNHYSRDMWLALSAHWRTGMLAVCLLPVFVSHVLMTSAQTLREVVHTVQNLDQPFDDRLVFRLGGVGYNGWIWPYAQFILRHTPPTATIGIPPQSDTWKMEGNVAYMRWFLYPRTLVNPSSPEEIPQNVDYLLIAQGDCFHTDCGWPKQRISEDQIRAIYGFNKETVTEYPVLPQAFTPKTIPWGLLWLKGGK